MKKKLSYWLSNIILIIYAIAYIPIWRLVISSETNVNSYNGYQKYIMPYERSKDMLKISILIILVCMILKLIFNAKKLEINKTNRVINIIVMISVIVILGIFTLFIQVA